MNIDYLNNMNTFYQHTSNRQTMTRRRPIEFRGYNVYLNMDTNKEPIEEKKVQTIEMPKPIKEVQPQVSKPIETTSVIAAETAPKVIEEQPKSIVKKHILLCGIGKMENHYIREWVEWYKDLGFDNICLYDNNDVDGEHFEEVIQDYIDNGFVILKNKRGLKNQQICCYNECFKEFKKNYDWIAFFDIDEFLEIDKNKYSTVHDFVNDGKFNGFHCIRVCWRNYNDSGILKVVDNNYSITRFTEYNQCDPQTKSILRTSTEGSFTKDNPHIMQGRIRACNTVGAPCPNAIGIRRKVTYENAFLKHYRFKTIEEYVMNKMIKLWPTTYKGGGTQWLTIDKFFEFNKRTQEKVDYANQLLNNRKNG